MRNKGFKAIIASLLIVAIMIVQVSQMQLIHGMADLKNTVSLLETSSKPELRSVVEDTYSSDEVIINEIEPAILAAGGNHSLQVKNDGTVWAWGDNSYGQLGDGTTTNRTIAVQVKNLKDVVAVSAGYNSSIALKSDGTVWSWGGNEETVNSVPLQVVGLKDITSISAGCEHYLALKSDGTVWGWGDNFYRQLGDETSTEILEPIQIKGLSNIKNIASGYWHSLALKSDGTVWALGYNYRGQLGNGTFTDSSIPVEVSGLSDVVGISAGEEYSMALKNDGTVFAWGDNSYGQLGVETYPDDPDSYSPSSSGNSLVPSEVPLQINGLKDVVNISAGTKRPLLLKSDETVWTCSYNGHIEIYQVEGISDITAVAAVGYSGGLALKSDETLWAWGNNEYGQLGDGTTSYRDTPVLSKDLVPPTAPTYITTFVDEVGAVLNWDASTDEGCVAGYEIYRDDIKIGTTSDTTYTDTDMNEVVNYHKYTVKCYDSSGNISEGAVTVINDREAPSVPLNLKETQKTTKISIEWEPSTDNTWVEGYVVYRNGEEIGYTDSTNFSESNVPQNTTYTYTVKAYDSSENFSEASSPLVVTTETIESVALSANNYHSLQVKDDGTVWAWGYNNKGQLGDGTYAKRIAAVKINDLKDVVSVAAGYEFSLALKNDGTVWAWGDNSNRQLGYGSDYNYYESTINKPKKIEALSDIISIEAGNYHAIALEGNGTVWTWGNNSCGQLGIGNFYKYNYPRKIDTLDNVIDVSAGGDFNVALKSDGTVWAWGSNSSGQIGEGTTKSNESVPVQIIGLTDIIDVKAGNNHILALKKDRTVWSWGANGAGQLGNETTINSKVPVNVNGLSDVIDLGAGYNSSIALKKDGTVWTWGTNNYGQLGDGTTTARLSPVQVNQLSDVVKVAMGTFHSLALKSDETLWTWGYNNSGRLGDETETDRRTPVLSGDKTPPSTPANISVTKSYNKIVLKWDASTDLVKLAGYELYRDDVKIATTTVTTYTDADLNEINKMHVYYVRAFDDAGNLSEAAKVVVNDSEAPSKPLNLKAVSNSPTTVSLEWEASTDNAWVTGYEIYRDGKKIGESNETNFTDKEVPHNATYTYTVKAYDQSGNYSIESSAISATTGLLKTVPIAAGETHSLQVRSDGTVWACGDNRYGKLGDGTNTASIEAIQVKSLKDIVAVSTGGYSSTALMNDGTVWAWGYNGNGQLGNGTTDNSNVPVKVKGLNDVIDVKAGYSHSLALKGDGTLWAWGSNYYGELGNGTQTKSMVPLQVSGLSNIIGIAAGEYFSLALKSDGTVWAWGMNNYGQLGDGTKNNSLIPVKVKDLNNIIDIKAGYGYVLALKSDKTVWAFGYNGYGQLGDGTKTNSNVPVQVKELSDVKAISASYNHNLALKNDGTVLAWGQNDCGQLGNETTFNSNVPVMVKGLTDVTDISAGKYHSLSKKSDGSIWAWGANSSGQLGDGTGINRIVPVPMDKNPIYTTVVSGFSATAEQNGIKLFWKLKTEDYVYGYKIYRSETIDGSYTMITQLNRSGMEYLDKNYQVGSASEPSEKTFYYKISAIDKYGFESNKSEAVSVIAKTDSTLPVVLSIDPKNNTIVGPSVYVTVKAEDNFGISDITLQYSLNETEWVDICTQSNNFFQWNNPVMNGKVYLRAIARDLAGNKSDGSPVITYIVDRQGPSKVTGLKAIPSAASIILNWEDVPEDDFSYFQVECKNPSDEFISVGRVSDKRGIELTRLQKNTTYTYRVCAYDRYGNRGEVSDEITVTTTEDTTKPVITYLGPVSKRYSKQLLLSAKIYDDVNVVNAVFQVSSDKVDWTDISTLTTSGSNAYVSYTYDISSLPEGKIYLRCVAKDSSNNISDGNPINEYIIDHTPPNALTNVDISSSTSSINLKWVQGTDEDLSHYNIYRSVDNGTYEIFSTGYKYLNISDRNVKNTALYKYKITAVDIAGNESGAYETQNAKLIEDMEKPKILSASYADNSTLPRNPRIRVLAEDNYMLSSVTMKYRRTSSENWVVVNTISNINKYNDVVTFDWNTAGLSEGKYDVLFTAKDVNGYESDEFKVSYSLNLVSPKAPELKATASGWKITLNWNSNLESDMAGYHILRSTDMGNYYSLISKTTNTTYEDTKVEAGKTYYYIVEAVDQYMNAAKSNAVSQVPTAEDKEIPIAVIKADSAATTKSAVLFDSKESYDNHKIEKVLWNFGDGTNSTEQTVYHQYKTAGDYTVQLSVYDSAGNIGTSEQNIKIFEDSYACKVRVLVVDESDGSGISGADLVVKLPDGTEKSLNADSNGLADIVVPFSDNQQKGSFTAYAFKNGYQPAKSQLQITAGTDATVVVKILPGEVVDGSLTFKRMTLDEIKAAGINVTSPKNQYVYSFTLKLGYKIICNGNGEIGNTGLTNAIYTIKDKQVYVDIIPGPDPSVPPTILYMEVPGEMTMLKEFFQVNLTVQNLAQGSEFILEDAAAKLNVPSGLKVVKGDIDQKLTPVNIGGGGEGKASWIIRGDEIGEYDLSAAFSAKLQPFDALIQKNFVTKDKLKVYGNSAIKIYCEAENIGYKNKPYLVRFGIENKASFPQNNFSFKLSDGTNFVYAENQDLDIYIPVLGAGEVKWYDFWLLPTEDLAGPLDLENTKAFSTSSVTEWEFRVIQRSRGEGLSAWYFDNENFCGSFEETTDESINFDWGASRPKSWMTSDKFSILWEGNITPKYDEEYTIRVASKQLVKVYLDDNKVIDSNENSTVNTFKISPKAGKHIRIEYHGDYSSGGIKMFWSSSTQKEEVIPTMYMKNSGAKSLLMIAVISKANGDLLNGAAISLVDENNNMYKVESGKCKVINQYEGPETAGFGAFMPEAGKYRLKVELPGYNPYNMEFDYKGYSQIMTVVLDNEISKTAPYIMAVFDETYRKSDLSLAYTEVEIGSSYQYRICTYINWRGHTPGKVLMVQGANSISSPDGIFEASLGKSFDSFYDNTYVVAEAADGSRSQMFQILIQIIPSSESGVDATEEILPAPVPLVLPFDTCGILDSDITCKLGPLQAWHKIDNVYGDNKIRDQYAFGIQLNKKMLNGNFDTIKKSFTDDWSKAINPIDTVTDSYKTAKLWEDVRKELQKNFGEKFFNYTNTIDFSAGAFAYAELIRAKDSPNVIKQADVGILVVGKASFTHEQQFFISWLPCVAFIKVEGKVEFRSLQDNLSFENLDGSEPFKITPKGTLKLEGSLEAGGGVGLAKVATLTLSGQFGPKVSIKYTPDQLDTSAKIFAKLNLKLKALAFEYKLALAEKEWPLN